jgi:hypothetical protein
MTNLEHDIEESLLWPGIHDYATSTVENRRR